MKTSTRSTSLTAAARRSTGAFTLVELMVATALGSMMMGWVGLSSVSLQRSFEASNYQMTAQNDQLRMLDYLSRDLRMASAVSVLNDGTKVTLSVPTAGSAGSSVNLGPVVTSLLGGSAPAVAGTDTVSYYMEGGQFIREFNGAQSVVADTIADLKFTVAGQFMTTDVLFSPRYSCSPTTATQAQSRASNSVFMRNASSIN